MSHYGRGVNELVLGHLKRRARAYVRALKKTPGRDRRPTVVVLPGGMGSELQCTNKQFESLSWPWSSPPTLHPLWIRVGELDRVMQGDPAYLQLDEELEERQRRICVATGALSVVGSPYRQVEAGLESRGINYLDFGFDWRKFSGQAADYLDYFLNALDKEARAAGVRSPLPVGLLAHSQGGLVAKLFAELCQANDDASASYSKARYRFIVTAGTPFFGTYDHVNRYYTGLSDFDKRFSVEFIVMYTLRRLDDEPNFSKAWMNAVDAWRTMVASMPGLYSLVPSPELERAEVRERLGLARSPVRDAEDSSRPLALFSDPDRLPPALAHYYPGHRDNHRREARRLAKALEGYARGRFFCVRGISKRDPINLELGLRLSTPLQFEFERGQVWTELVRHEALEVIAGNAGDGVVPAWSAVLDESGKNMTIRGANHRKIVAEPRVLDLVAALVRDEHWASWGTVEADEPAPEPGEDPELDDEGLIARIGAEFAEVGA